MNEQNYPPESEKGRTAELPPNTLNAATVTITRGVAPSVNANTVTVRQGVVKIINADVLVVRQGSVLKAESKQLEMSQSAVALVRSDTAELTTSRAAAVVAGGDVHIDQGSTKVVLARGDVHLDQAASVAVLARSVRSENSATVFLLANKIEGDVRTAFGTRESVIFGAVAGVVASIIMLVANMIKARKKKS